MVDASIFFFFFIFINLVIVVIIVVVTATIDYSENPALLYTGEAVELSQLVLRNLRTFEGW